MSDPRDLSQLFNSAAEEGALSQSSLDVLSLPDLGARIQQGLGVSVDDVPASEVFLLTLLVDDSASIRTAGNEALMIDGCNAILDALAQSKQQAALLVHTRYLNGTLLHPYVPISEAPRVDPSNYQATGNTPLYDECVATLGSVIARAQEFSNAGVPVRSATVVLTDGADCGSQAHSARSVRSLVRDMLRTEAHVIAALAFDDGSTDFRDVFHQMGFDDRWILTPKNTPSEIRAAFRVISQTAVRVSQASAVAAGGFAP